MLGKLKWLSFAAVLAAPAVPAMAQTTEQLPLPSVMKAIDKNGVDLIGGNFLYPTAQHSIGTGESGISLSRQGSTSPTAYKTWHHDNLGGAMNFQREGYEVPAYTVPTKAHMLVTYGGASYRFQQNSAGAWVPYKGGYATFACSSNLCTLTLTDGTVVEYDRNLVSTDINNESRDGQATKATKPDGEVITFTYDSARRRIAASSSLGWMLKSKVNDQMLAYQLINTAADFCNPAAFTCESLTAYPMFDNGRDVMGATITGTWSTSYTCGGEWTCSDFTHATPRGVTTVVKVPQYMAGGESPAYAAKRVSTISRAGSTWSYHTEYVMGNQPGAVLAKWRTYSCQPGGGCQGLVYWPEESMIFQSTDELGRKTSYRGFTPYIGPAWVIWPDASYSGTNTDPEAYAQPTGGYTVASYDARGNALKFATVPKNAAADGSQNNEWTAVYPTSCTNPKTCNKPDGITDPSGATTNFTYDPNHGGMLTKTGPLVNGVRPQTRYTYQQFTPYLKTSSGGTQAQPQVWRLISISTCRTMTLATCVGTTDEQKTVFTYNPTSSAFGARNLLPASKTVSRGDGSLAATVSFTYDRYGNVIVEDGPRTGTVDAVYHFYDLARRKIGTIERDPDASGSGLPRMATRTTYGSDGEVERVVKGTVTATTLTALENMTALERVEIEYSTAHGKPIVERRYGTGSAPLMVKQTSYDARLRPECIAVRMNPATFANLPAACSLGASGSHGQDRITRIEYDVTGAVIREIEGYGTSLARAERTHHYDSLSGRVDWVEDANGNRSGYEYDSYGRLYRLYFPQKSSVGAHAHNPSDYEQYGYDKRNLQTSKRLRSGETILYRYDALGRMDLKDLPGTADDVTYSYDLFGYVTSAGPNLSFDYDSFGRLLSHTSYGRQITYEYDSYGNREKLSWPGTQGFVTYTYDNLNRLKTIVEGGTNATLATINYDGMGRRDSMTRGGETTDYDYDTMSRLSGLGHDLAGTTSDLTYGYAYNAASQIVTRTISNNSYVYTGAAAVNRPYTVNGLNQYLTAGPTASFTYDARGNLTSDGSNTYGYDLENRLKTATGAMTANLSYDAIGRLYETSGGSVGTTRFFYDGDALIAEYSSTGTLLRRYVHGPGIDEPLVWYEGSGTSNRRYLNANHQGSIVGVADATGGSLAINAYDAYGIPAPGNQGRFQYTGQISVPELGMYHYKARAYSPTLGRFMQTDPTGYEDQMNLYAYVGNQPVNKTDPTGLYGRAGNWDDEEWKRFNRAQQRAATDFEKSAKALRSALAEGGNFAKAQEKFEQTYGAGSGTRENMSNVADKLEGAAAAMRDDGSGGYWAKGMSAAEYANSGAPSGSVMANPLNGKTMFVNVEHPEFSKVTTPEMAYFVGHEAGHGVGLDHLPIGGVEPYARGNPAQRALYQSLDSATALGNPDRLYDYGSGIPPF